MNEIACRVGRISLLGLTLVLVRAGETHAGAIGFSIKSTVHVQDSVTVQVELRNTGDEAAAEVKPSVSLGDTGAVGAAERTMGPGQTHTWTLTLPDSAPGPGAYVALVRVAYEDTNGYPFEVLAAANFTVGVTPRTPIRGTLQIPAVRQNESANGRLTLAIPKERAGNVDITLAIPSGLVTQRRTFHLRANSNGRAQVAVKVQNTTLLPGTVVNIFALVTGTEEIPPQTDVVKGEVRIVAPTPVVANQLFATAAVALLIYLFALEAISGVRRRFSAPDEDSGVWLSLCSALLVLAPSVFLLTTYPWDAILSKSITAGGDMASLYYPTKLLADEILPSGQITGWTMGNYAGFPVLHFYSTLPFVLIVLLGKLIAMPVAFKLVTLSGPTLLPLAAAYLFRSLGYRKGVPALASVSVLPFLLQQGNSMWGGNIPSVLAGEFCHSLGITLSLVFLGVLHRTTNGRGSWPLAGLLFAAIGLCHTFAFFAAAWYSLFFLWPRKDIARTAPPTLAVYAIAFLLLCIWGLPLPGRLVFTSEWSMIWNIKDWREVLPPPLWPAAVLAGAGLICSAMRLKEFIWDRQGVLVFVFLGGALLYFLVPALGFPDIRFIPISQLFLGFLAADFVGWVAGASRHRMVFCGVVVLAVLAWGDTHLGYIPSWLKWNYSGYEGKNTWSQFKEINDAVRGGINDPRVIFEHSQTHNRFGSSRAFENLPLFSGRSTLEGVFHQASQNSPFIFFLQSEASERGSGPFPQYTYTRLNPEKALPHLRLYNVDTIIAVSDKARQAYEQNPAFKKTFSSGSYAVFKVDGGNTGYVIPAQNEPVLYNGPDWKLAFYRWFKHHELLDVPLVPADLLNESQQREFKLRTDAIERLPRSPISEACEVHSRLEQYRIHIDTTCPGKPHIVKVSYFPRWHAEDGSILLPVSPGFMLVYPRSRTVDLVYRRNTIDWIGVSLSLGGLIAFIVFSLNRSWADQFVGKIRSMLSPVLIVWSRWRIPIAIMLVVIAATAATGTRLKLRYPDREYDDAQEAYKARDFPAAIKLYEHWTNKDRDTFKQATALYNLGVSHSELDHHAAAVTVLERLRFQFPNVDYTAGTLFHLARNYAAIGSTDDAKTRVTELVKGYPDSNWVRRVKTEMPQLLTDSTATRQ